MNSGGWMTCFCCAGNFCAADRLLQVLGSQMRSSFLLQSFSLTASSPWFPRSASSLTGFAEADGQAMPIPRSAKFGRALPPARGAPLFLCVSGDCLQLTPRAALAAWMLKPIRRCVSPEGYGSWVAWDRERVADAVSRVIRFSLGGPDRARQGKLCGNLAGSAGRRESIPECRSARKAGSQWRGGRRHRTRFTECPGYRPRGGPGRELQRRAQEKRRAQKRRKPRYQPFCQHTGASLNCGRWCQRKFVRDDANFFERFGRNLSPEKFSRLARRRANWKRQSCGGVRASGKAKTAACHAPGCWCPRVRRGVKFSAIKRTVWCGSRPSSLQSGSASFRAKNHGQRARFKPRNRLGGFCARKC
jgi:hypothetical protein